MIVRSHWHSIVAACNVLKFWVGIFQVFPAMRELEVALYRRLKLPTLWNGFMIEKNRAGPPPHPSGTRSRFPSSINSGRQIGLSMCGATYVPTNSTSVTGSCTQVEGSGIRGQSTGILSFGWSESGPHPRLPASSSL